MTNRITEGETWEPVADDRIVIREYDGVITPSSAVIWFGGNKTLRDRVLAEHAALRDAREALECEHQVKPEYGNEAHCKHCGIVLTLGWTPYEVLKAALRPPASGGQ